VDGDNRFVANKMENNNVYISDAETPYGPYTCKRCGAEYDDLDDELVEQDELIGRKVIFKNPRGEIVAIHTVKSFSDTGAVQIPWGTSVISLETERVSYEILAPEKKEKESPTVCIKLSNLTPEQLDEIMACIKKHGIIYGQEDI
jgi:hypothetical protein